MTGVEDLDRLAVFHILAEKGPSTNRQIRTELFGAGEEEQDPAGRAVTKALQGLQHDGLVVLDGSPRRWRVAPGRKP